MQSSTTSIGMAQVMAGSVLPIGLVAALAGILLVVGALRSARRRWV